MAAHPADLVRGRGDDGTPGRLAAAPVLRLWTGQPVPLPGGVVTGAPAAAPPAPPPPPPAGGN